MGANARGLADGELSWPHLASRLEEFLLAHFPQMRHNTAGQAS
jgi:hypothetical protein